MVLVLGIYEVVVARVLGRQKTEALLLKHIQAWQAANTGGRCGHGTIAQHWHGAHQVCRSFVTSGSLAHLELRPLACIKPRMAAVPVFVSDGGQSRRRASSVPLVQQLSHGVGSRGDLGM